MLTNYVKRYSPALGRDMEYKTYGDKGKAVLVFPSQNGRFFDYENMGMVGSIADYIESGKIRLICVDSIDGETWSNAEGDPRWRIEQHERWFHHVIDEVIPEQRRDGETFMVTGCSMGGYHAGNFFFRRPDIFDTLISLSGLYHASFFFGDYSDELVYNNSPLDFLTWMPDDHYYLDIYRRRRIICCVGQGDWEADLLDSTQRLDAVLSRKNVPHWADYWGWDVSHDWPWWRKQIAYFLGKVVG